MVLIFKYKLNYMFFIVFIVPSWYSNMVLGENPNMYHSIYILLIFVFKIYRDLLNKELWYLNSRKQQFF